MYLLCATLALSPRFATSCPFYLSTYSGDVSTVTVSCTVAGVTFGYAVQISVKRVSDDIGEVDTPHDGVEVCVHESPLVPVTVQLSTLVALQYSRVRSPDRTSIGRASRCPVAVKEIVEPPDAPRDVVAEKEVNSMPSY